jgi:hypothetical protein
MQRMDPPGDDLEVRFDDLTRPRPVALRFSGPLGVIRARRPADVGAALEEAEAATGRGHWVAGFVSY